MSFADAVAFCGLMIAIVSVAGILLDMHNRRLKHREKDMELRVRLAEAEGHSREAALPRIEERLRVLERLATDRGPDLARQIEELRDHTPTVEKLQ